MFVLRCKDTILMGRHFAGCEQAMAMPVTFDGDHPDLLLIGGGLRV